MRCDGGGPNYKRSRSGNSEIDRIMTQVLEGSELPEAKLHDFWPYGYDERQFCSPGFNLPVGLFQRSLYGEFPEYHTSADNLDFIKPEYLEQSYNLIIQAIEVAERNWTPLNMSPKGEPQLGRRGLYGNTGGIEMRLRMRWLCYGCSIWPTAIIRSLIWLNVPGCHLHN